MSSSPSYKGFPLHLFDHGAAALQRVNDERNREIQRQARAEKWLADRLAGQTFHSFESLVECGSRLVETVTGPMTEDERRILTNAARALWAGLAERQRCTIDINERGRVERLTIRAA